MSSRRGGWDYPYNEPSGSWDQQLGALQDQWPDMLKQVKYNDTNRDRSRQLTRSPSSDSALSGREWVA